MIEKKYRLKKANDFQTIILSQQVEKNQSFSIYYLITENNTTHVGLSVSKKLGNAVIRNKIKRQVRHMTKNLIDFTKNIDLVVIVRANYKKNIFSKNQDLLSDLLKRVWRKIDEQNKKVA